MHRLRVRSVNILVTPARHQETAPGADDYVFGQERPILEPDAEIEREIIQRSEEKARREEEANQ